MLSLLRLPILFLSVLLLMAGSSRAQIRSSFRTVDGNNIKISAQNGKGDGPVRLCLSASPDRARRQVKVHGFGTLEAANGSPQCTVVPAIEIRLEFVKPLPSGITLSVGHTKLDLSGYGHGSVMLTWERY